MENMDIQKENESYHSFNEMNSVFWNGVPENWEEMEDEVLEKIKIQRGRTLSNIYRWIWYTHTDE